MRTIYEHPEYNQLFEEQKRLAATFDDLTHRQNELVTLMQNKPAGKQPTMLERARRVLGGEPAVIAGEDTAAAVADEFTRIGQDLNAVRQGKEELALKVSHMRGKVTAERLNQRDVLAARLRVRKALQELLEANRAAEQLCDVLSAGGFAFFPSELRGSVMFTGVNSDAAAAWIAEAPKGEKVAA